MKRNDSDIAWYLLNCATRQELQRAAREQAAGPAVP